MSTRAGIYVRISNDPHQISNDPHQTRAGVERQRTDCEALCQQRGWDVVDRFEDNDVSAYSEASRPAYKRLIGAVEAGELDAVVAYHADRLTRAPRELETLVDLIEQTGIAIATVTSGDVDLVGAGNSSRPLTCGSSCAAVTV